MGRYTRCSCTFTLAGSGPQVSGCDEAEASRAVGGHGALIQGDDLVTEVQRAVQACTQLLHNPHNPYPRHLLDHCHRGVQLMEDDLREKETQAAKESVKRCEKVRKFIGESVKYQLFITIIVHFIPSVKTEQNIVSKVDQKCLNKYV